MLLAIGKELPWSASSPTGSDWLLGAGSMNTRTAPLVKTALTKDMSWALFVSPCDFRTRSM
jgi:hypothetical protein